MDLIDEILTEWAYRVHDGMPNPKNPLHLVQLEDSLNELKLPKPVSPSPKKGKLMTENHCKKIVINSEKKLPNDLPKYPIIEPIKGKNKTAYSI